MDRANIASVIRSLRRVNLQGSFFGQTVAIRFGLSESDVEALELLLDSGSSTAGRLSELMGLTTGAVTRVIDRLEQAGYVRRVPDPSDRRRVVIEVIPERVSAFEETIDRVGAKGADEIRHFSDADLIVINDFLTRMATITREEATALRDTPQVEVGTEATHSAPLGGLSAARLAFRSGANELTLRGTTSVTDLYQATFQGPIPKVRLRDGVVSVQYQGHGMPWDWRKRHADVALNRTIPWELELSGGANRLLGDLVGVDVRSFRLHGGVDRVRLDFGRPSGEVPIRIDGGASELRITRPKGVAVRLAIHGGAGGIELDRQRMGGVGGTTVLESAGASSDGAYAIDLHGGAGRIIVKHAGGTDTAGGA